MKNKISIIAIITILLTGLQSCAVVGGIFKAGAATGIIAVILVLALIIFLISRAFKSK